MMITETYSERFNGIQARISQTRIEAITRKNITRIGVRVYDGKHLGVAGAIGSDSIDSIKQQAQANLGLKVGYPLPPTSNHKQKLAFDKSPIARKAFIPEVEELLEQLREAHPGFSFSNKVSLVTEQTQLSNTSGLDLDHSSQHLNLALLIKDRQSTNIIDAYFLLQSRRYQREVITKGIRAVCDAYQNRVELPRQKRFPVVFFSNDGLPIRKLLTDLNGWTVGAKSSVLSDRLGEKVFNERFTLLQSRHPEDTTGPFFDAEGVVNRGYQFALIENGVLKAPYTDKKCAAKFKLPRTGSAVCEYDGAPAPGLEDWKIKESAQGIKDLLGGQRGVLIYIAQGGDFSARGDFGSPVQLAFLFDGEKLLGRLPPIQISSNLFDMFGRDYRGVSKEKVNPLESKRYLVLEMNVAKS